MMRVRGGGGALLIPWSCGVLVVGYIEMASLWYGHEVSE